MRPAFLRKTKTDELGMRQLRLSTAVVWLFERLPLKRLSLKLICRLEGGEMTSQSLRVILRKYYRVEVGIHSYGSLLSIGMSDPGTEIGPYVSCGPNVRRIGAAHPVDRPLLHPYWYNERFGVVGPDKDVVRTGCVIGADVWLGANVTILPGCTRIGRGAVIGAGAVVTKNVEPFSINAGVPSKQIGKRLTEPERVELDSVGDWSRSPQDLERIVNASLRESSRIRSENN